MTSILKVDNIQNASGTSALSIDSSGNLDLANKGGQILEVLAMNCDGEDYVVRSGTYTSTNVTTHQGLTTTFADVTGSSVAYTPPTGTKVVIYEFNYQVRGVDAHGIAHLKFMIDTAEVVYARSNISANSAMSGRYHFKWAIPIGGTTSANTGRIASWSSAKTLKLQAREYGSSNETNMHQSQHWNGSGTSTFMAPSICITAIG